jgi:hypothetical protein
VIASGSAMEIAEALGARARQANKAFAISTIVFDSAEFGHPPEDAQTLSLTKDVDTRLCFGLYSRLCRRRSATGWPLAQDTRRSFFRGKDHH